MRLLEGLLEGRAEGTHRSGPPARACELERREKLRASELHIGAGFAHSGGGDGDVVAVAECLVDQRDERGIVEAGPPLRIDGRGGAAVGAPAGGGLYGRDVRRFDPRAGAAGEGDGKDCGERALRVPF